MKQIALFGLGNFGKSVLDELSALPAEVLIIDRDKDLIDGYKDSPAHGVVLDILSLETLRKALPESIDAVVIDTGERIEASILGVSYCAKLGVKTIIAKAETESHAEILELVGASKVIFPNREAAKRVTRQLFSSVLHNYIPISPNLVIAEMTILPALIGKRLCDSRLREQYGLTLLSIRQPENQEFQPCPPDYLFQKGDIGLLFGPDNAIHRFSDAADQNKKEKKSSLQSLKAFAQLFKRKKENKT
ncbi:MAG: TrkA family potassium uptake protein [Spirochaetaceae bacterium]|jgi:trk system potassium uptake protein TrkA|nr:TrkA family potassium uptake protein [Spirochaetaceae bacterium]